MDIREMDVKSLEDGIIRNTKEFEKIRSQGDIDADAYLDFLEFIVAYATQLTRLVEEEIREEVMEEEPDGVA